MECDDPAKLAAIKALKDGIHYRPGTRRPYRAAPADFAETFARLGWGDELLEHYRCNDRSIRRWIDECGGDEVRARRSAVTGQPFKERRSRYPTYAEAVAAIMRGETVEAIARLAKKSPAFDTALREIALDRGYRLVRSRWRAGAQTYLYGVRNRLNQPVFGFSGEGMKMRTAASREEITAWLKHQPLVQW